ncbi:DUF2339 domain-containing protein [Massilia sp. H-1]|nr:DUF2339 domain-containing protein [Massilia sp. H-1]
MACAQPARLRLYLRDRHRLGRAALRGKHEHYLSAQLFLILFFLFYVAIAVVYAMRRTVEDKTYVDATIVFGTALAAFGLQLGLMKHVEFGNAFSALGFGLFYIALSAALWRRRAGNLKLLVESFLVLGVVFGTLAIPFALDGRWTSAAWALEGAGVAWVALRQRQRLAFMFGMLVQAGAWISFIGAVSGLAPQAAKESNLWLGFLVLAASAFFMATTLRRHKDGEDQAFPHASSWFLAFAAVWFMAKRLDRDPAAPGRNHASEFAGRERTGHGRHPGWHFTPDAVAARARSR